MSKPRGSGLSWRERQERDPFVQKARRDGWRSRAVYKLEEIDNRERLLRPDMTCVDLGAAPGSWSQYVTTKLKGRARIVAIDLLPMDSLPNTDFIQGDFTDDAVLEELQALLGDEKPFPRRFLPGEKRSFSFLRASIANSFFALAPWA